MVALAILDHVECGHDLSRMIVVLSQSSDFSMQAEIQPSSTTLRLDCPSIRGFVSNQPSLMCS